MKLIVSGDSWTFGSELRDPNVFQKNYQLMMFLS